MNIWIFSGFLSITAVWWISTVSGSTDPPDPGLDPDPDNDSADTNTTVSTTASTTAHTSTTIGTTVTSTAATKSTDTSTTIATTVTSTAATDTTTTAATVLTSTTATIGTWGFWGTWTSCSSHCGTGTKYRSRTCSGSSCDGDTIESTTCTTGTQCYAPKVFDLVLVIDDTLYYSSYKRQFFQNVTNTFEIGLSRTRVAAVKMASTSGIWFDFITYTSNSDVSSKLSDISYRYGSPTQSEALSLVRATLLTTEKGARTDVSDVVVMLTSTVSSSDADDVIEAAQRLKDNGVYLIIIEEAYSLSYAVLTSVADVHQDFYGTFGSLDIKVAAAAVTSGFPSNYFCASSFFAYDSPSALSTGNDTSSGSLYLMTDSQFQLTCCGVVSGWSFFAVNYGTVQMMVFRQTGMYSYNLVGTSKIIVTEDYVNTEVAYSLTTYERIAVVEGDIIGWYTTGTNMVAHADCSATDCPSNNKRLSIPASTFNAGDTIDFSTADTVPNRAYSIKVSTSNNTEFTLITIQNETELEWNTPIGYKALYFRVADSDLNENFTWELSGDHSLFVLSELQYERITLNLNAKLPPGGGPYVITVKCTDSCQHTASATVTVSTYNAPPIINNLPYIYEISETTKSDILLFTINVTDATNDPICCTLSYSLPVSQNFELKYESDVYTIWTVENPAFAYNDVDQYRIFICCQDPYGSTTIYLVLRLTQEEKTKIVPNPGWFYRAIGISLVPIVLMTVLASTALVYTMFFLEGDVTYEHVQISEQGDEVQEKADKTEGTFLTNDSPRTDVNTIQETIEFRNLYNDEIVNIPIWKGVGKQTSDKTSDAKLWANSLKRDQSDFFITQSQESNILRTQGDAFGVDLKLFHYGGRPKTPMTEEESAIQVLRKKNEMKEKWKKLTEETKKKTIFRKKRGSVQENFRASSEIEGEENTEYEKKQTTMNMPPNSSQVMNIDGVDKAQSPGNVSIEAEIHDIFSIFDEVVETGRASKDTRLAEL